MNSSLNSTFKGPRVVITTTVSTTPYTLDDTSSEALSVNAVSSAITINLPLISTVLGRSFTIRKVDASANAVIIAGAGSDLIEGVASITLDAQWQSVTLDNDGTQWHTVSTNSTTSSNIPGTATGEVLFVNASLEPVGNTNFRWDNVNGRLGVGIATPTVTLDVAGDIHSSTNIVATGQVTGATVVGTTVSLTNLSQVSAGSVVFSSPVTVGVATTSQHAARQGDVDVLNTAVAALQTTAAITLYVDTAGSDSNAGTVGSPFLTVQKAIDVLPKKILHPVIINVGAGNFAGIYFSGFQAGYSSPTVQGTVSIVGTAQAATLSSGVTSGTIASATAGSNATWGTAQITSAGWTVDNLRGKMIRVDSGTGAGQIRQIISNTTDTVTIPGAWTAPTGATVSIIEQGTIFNSASTAGSSSTCVLKLCMGSISTDAILQFDTCKFTTVTRGLYCEQFPGLRLVRCWMGASNHCINWVEGSGFLYLDDSLFSLSVSTVQQGIQLRGGALTSSRNIYSGNVSGIGNQSPVNMLSINDYFYANTVTGISVYGGSATVTGCKFDGVTPGTRSGVLTDYHSANAVAGASKIALNACDISNCGTAVNCRTPGAYVTMIGTCTGTGNTTAYSATLGGAIRVTAASTLTGTTEISVDGTAYTLATMRAASPKVINNLNYGSMVFE